MFCTLSLHTSWGFCLINTETHTDIRRHRHRYTDTHTWMIIHLYYKHYDNNNFWDRSTDTSLYKRIPVFFIYSFYGTNLRGRHTELLYINILVLNCCLTDPTKAKRSKGNTVGYPQPNVLVLCRRY